MLGRLRRRRDSSAVVSLSDAELRPGVYMATCVSCGALQGSVHNVGCPRARTRPRFMRRMETK